MTNISRAKATTSTTMSPAGLILLFMSLWALKVAALQANGLSGSSGDGPDLSEMGLIQSAAVSNSNSNSNAASNNNRFQHLLANLRFRRQVATFVQHQQQQQPQQRRAPLAPIQQQMFDDEQTIRSQLPDLIAQARNDKAVERALLKMLINASLRSALSNMADGPQQSLAATGGQQWAIGAQDDGATGDQRPYPARFSRLDQQQQQQHNFDSLDSLTGAIDSLTSGPNANGASQLVQSDQFQQLQQQQPGLQMDKREYIKPCSFNAVSCVRTPFRKL